MLAMDSPGSRCRRHTHWLVGGILDSYEDHTVTPWQQQSDGHLNWRFIIVMVYITFIMLMTAFALWKIQDQQDTLKAQSVDFANRICVSSNAARQSLFDLLDYAEIRVKQQAQTGGATQEQVDNAVDFYEKAKNKIHFTECPPPLPEP